MQWTHFIFCTTHSLHFNFTDVSPHYQFVRLMFTAVWKHFDNPHVFVCLCDDNALYFFSLKRFIDVFVLLCTTPTLSYLLLFYLTHAHHYIVIFAT